MGRSILALIDAAENTRLRNVSTLEARIRSVGFFASALRDSYGQVRWRVLPEKIRKILLGSRLYAGLSDCLHEVFDGLPDLPPPKPVPPGAGPWLRRIVTRPGFNAR